MDPSSTGETPKSKESKNPETTSSMSAVPAPASAAAAASPEDSKPKASGDAVSAAAQDSTDPPHPELPIAEKELQRLLARRLQLADCSGHSSCDEGLLKLLKEFPPSAWREAEQFPSQHYAVIATLCQDQEKSLPELAEQLLTRILQVWTSHEEVDIGSEGQEVSEEQRSALEQLLQKTIPVVAKRKSYGLLKVSDLEANENTDPECRWVWEAEVMDHIPRALRAEVRSSRRHRMADAAHLRAVAKLVSMYSSKKITAARLKKQKDRIADLRDRVQKIEEKIEQDAEKARMLEAVQEQRRREKEEALRKQQDEKERQQEERQAAEKKRQEAKRLREERKAREEAKKEAELKKKRDQQAILFNFFNLDPSPKRPGAAASGAAGGMVGGGGELKVKKKKAEALPRFLAFELGRFMTLAPRVPKEFLPHEKIEAILFPPELSPGKKEGERRFIAAASPEEVQIDARKEFQTLLQTMKRKKQEEEEERKTGKKPLSGGDVKKLLQFHTEYRPAWYGRGHVRAKQGSRVVGRRRPFHEDPLWDYTVDSDDEWGDEPEDGEDLSEDGMSDDGEDDILEGGAVKIRSDGYVQEDDDFLVPEDDPLEGGVGAGIAMVGGRGGHAAPLILGPLWDVEGTAAVTGGTGGERDAAAVAQVFLPFRMQKLISDANGKSAAPDNFGLYLQQLKQAEQEETEKPKMKNKATIPSAAGKEEEGMSGKEAVHPSPSKKARLAATVTES